MEANRDEAIKCIAVAQRHLTAGNLPSARRFAEKSLSFAETPEAKRLLEIVALRESEPEGSASTKGNSNPSASASGAETHATKNSTHQRHTAKSSGSNANGSAKADKKNEYTPDMVAVVRRVRKCKVTEYYEIMGLQKECEENDVKKAYRKLALQLHPDKNYAPGADEAFKMVSKAFQVLSDPQKRAIFDQSGDDPESRFSGMSRQEGFGTPGGGGGFQGEMSPEDLFNMFFGGGGPAGFAGGFNGGFGGPVFTTTFGPGGFRATRMGGGIPRQRQGDANQNQTQSNRSLLQLLPFLFIFFFPIISGIFSSIFSTPALPDPSYAFAKTSQYHSQRYTSPHQVPYFVDAQSFSKHPIYQSIPEQHRSQPIAGDFSSKLRTFESKIEERFAGHYWDDCQREHQRKQNDIDRERGIFGFGADLDKIEEIQNRKIQSCEILREHRFIT